jgi:predicted SAM-dependent methyltransferase
MKTNLKINSDLLQESKILTAHSLNYTHEKLRELSSSEDLLEKYKFDMRRIATTIDYIKSFKLDQNPCIEIGSLAYTSAKVIWSFFPYCDPIETKCDLRYSNLPFENESISSVICTEVIEHLSDQKYAEATTLSGLIHFLKEVYRILKVGGRALITTPNAASIWALYRACKNEQPMMYDWHFREYTCDELESLYTHIGFEIIELNTEFVWYRYNFDSLILFLKSQGFPLERRGDDIFCVLEKPAIKLDVPLALNLPI